MDREEKVQLEGSNNNHNNKKCWGAQNMTLVKSYISSLGADDMEYTKDKDKSSIMLKDALGSTIALTDRNGKSIARIGYDAWGNFKYPDKAKESCVNDNYREYLNRYCNTRNFGSKYHNSWAFGKKFATNLTPYLYTGRRYNNFTTQYFNRNRYYQPKYARFTSKDPIGFNGGYNMYSYVGNNPVNRVDPMGLASMVMYDDGDPDITGAAKRASIFYPLTQTYQPTPPKNNLFTLPSKINPPTAISPIPKNPNFPQNLNLLSPKTTHPAKNTPSKP